MYVAGEAVLVVFCVRSAPHFFESRRAPVLLDGFGDDGAIRREAAGVTAPEQAKFLMSAFGGKADIGLPRKFFIRRGVPAAAGRMDACYYAARFSGESRMKNIVVGLAAIAAIALIGAPAFAADMAVKAPLPAPAPVYNWAGRYAGVNAGASFGNVKTDFNAPVTFTLNEGAGPGSGSTDFAGSNREYPSGFIGGGQIGYNWQLSPIWVVGLEADAQGAIEKDSNTLTNNFNFFFAVPGTTFIAHPVGSTALDYQTKIDWFGTVRGRIGYVWGNGEVLSYVTGGLTYGKVDVEGTSTVSVNGPSPVTQAFGHSAVNIGWVVGYGTEGHLPLMPGNWTWKIEGLYMDLGTLDATGSGGFASLSGGGETATTTAGPVTTHTHFTDGILRAGLNYQFH